MNTMHELRQFLQKYGAFIYTGDRVGDLELLEMELKQLYEWNMIDSKLYQQGLLILKRELNEVKKNIN